MIEVAKLVGVNPMTVRYWRDFKSSPNAITMIKIKKVSRGRVQYQDMIEPFVKYRQPHY